MATTAFPTSPSFAGHETFTLRYGWLKKAVDAVHEDPLVFTRDDALVRLGVGKNMVRAIRHWGLATRILLVGLQSLSEQAKWKRVAPNSLRRDVDCFIRTYVPSRATRTLVLEETLDCPLAELGLIQEIEAGRLFAFVRDEHPSLSAGIVAFSLIRYWETTAGQRQTLTFDEVAYRPGSPGRVFKLSENALTEYLESIEQFTERAISYDVTAGLRQLYRRKPVDPLETLCNQYSMTTKA